MSEQERKELPAMNPVFLQQTLVCMQLMMKKFLDGSHDIKYTVLPDGNAKVLYEINGLGGKITIEETVTTEKEVKEMIMPYGDIGKKLITEYVRRNLNREYDKGETND